MDDDEGLGEESTSIVETDAPIVWSGPMEQAAIWLKECSFDEVMEVLRHVLEKHFQIPMRHVIDDTTPTTFLFAGDDDE